jgi:predicted TIM-barrel fold metal-dependent hydrolase
MNNASPTIWDIHCHLNSVPGRTPEERMVTFLSYAARLGINRVFMSMGLRLTTHPTPDDLRRQNDEVLAAIAHHHDRAFGLCYASGAEPEASVREIDRCIRDGPMVGIKLWVARRASDRSLDAIAERAGALNAPILQHTWFKTDGTQGPDESSPLDLVALARRHPETRFICGHCGGNWELGIRAVRDVKNMVVETAGFDPTTGMVEMAVRELGPERIVYGSDAFGRSFASQLAKVLGADVPDSAKRLILAGNLRRLFGPILRAKGVRVD